MHVKRTLLRWLPAAVLVLLGAVPPMTGCKRQRLFTHLDSIPAVPSQFHVFDNFSYDDSLSLAIDGLTRENMRQFALSAYYPSSSAFNQNTGELNSKQIQIFDPVITTQFANPVSNTIFQFAPNISYIGLISYYAYDTAYAPKKTVVPSLAFYPEDVYHPYQGTTGVRLLDGTAPYQYGGYAVNLVLTPSMGQGTSLTLTPFTLTSSYSTTQQGLKNAVLTIQLAYNLTARLTFLPFLLDDAKNYSFLAVGDMINYKNGKEPRPRLFLMEDGVPSSLHELTLSNLNYSNVAGTSVTIVNGVYNIPAPGDQGITNNFGFDVRFNQVKANVIRWPQKIFGTGEDVGLGTLLSITDSAGAVGALTGREATASLTQNGTTSVTVTPGSAFSPYFQQFDYDFEPNINYTLCLLPNNGTTNTMDHLVLENDLSPDPNLFRLRLVNMMGGATQVDVHTGSASGPVIAGGISFGTATGYISFTPTVLAQNLYITLAGSTTPLFQVGSHDLPISLPFTAGNSGTIFLTGLPPGVPYSGDPGYFPPYVYYHSDAYVNSNHILSSAQLYIIL